MFYISFSRPDLFHIGHRSNELYTVEFNLTANKIYIFFKTRPAMTHFKSGSLGVVTRLDNCHIYKYYGL